MKYNILLSITYNTAKGSEKVDNELILFDRINVIKDVIKKYGESNFYVSFSGGKDSTVVHYLIDEALPNNTIPRVFCNTGIEYEHIVDFVKEMKTQDNRIVIIDPTKNIGKILKEDGYPFKSKEFSHVLAIYQRSGMQSTVERYLNEDRGKYKCPNVLRYMFQDDFNIKISEKCCLRFKKEPFKKWEKENNRHTCITGMMSQEGGARESIKGCVITSEDGKIKKFHPLLKVSSDWEEWYIKKRNIHLCKLYYEPYNFLRTGCKGCPYSLRLQDQLETMSRLLPNERKQCEFIWKPIYEEYRRIGYRLKAEEQIKFF